MPKGSSLNLNNNEMNDKKKEKSKIVTLSEILKKSLTDRKKSREKSKDSKKSKGQAVEIINKFTTSEIHSEALSRFNESQNESRIS